MVPEPPPPPPPDSVKLVLRNAGRDELQFTLDKGWSSVVFAYSGKPPRAKSVMLFPRWCTSSCDVAAAEMCPKCAEPTDPRRRQEHEREETKREVVAAGEAFELEWDGNVAAYEKVPGKRRCECWRPAPPPPETYTIKACGMRAARRVGASSKIVCTETTVQLPVELGTSIELVFDK